MKEFLGKEAELLVIGAVTGVGVLVRLLLFGYYAGLGKACRAPKGTKNRTIMYIRRDLKQREENGEKINNAALYTECRLAERRIGGIRLGTLECIWQQSLLLMSLCAVLTAFAALFRRAEFGKVLFLLFAGGVAVFGLLVLDLLGGIKEKSKRVRLCIREYIENGRINRMEREAEAEPARSRRKEAKQEKKERKRERKAEKKERKEEYCAERIREKEEKKRRKEAKGSVRTAKRGKRKGKAQEEKRRLTEELLRERRQLEARSLAEQRRKEREEESSENRAEAEAAVTECAQTMFAESVKQAIAENGKPEVQEEEQVSPASSYEELLNGVLAEYLA